MRKFLWLAIAVVVVVALWTAGWFWAVGEASRQVRLLAEADGESAPKLTCGTFDVSGFPFRFDAECLDATLVDRDVTATFAGLKASVLVYNPSHVIFSAKAPLAYADAFSGSKRRLDFGGMEGSLRLTAGDLMKGFGGEGWRIGRFSVVADDLTLTDTVASEIVEARAKHLEAHLIDDPQQHDQAAGTSGLMGYLAATALDLPGLQVAGADLTAETQLTGVPDDLRAFGDPDALRRWQAAGGTLTLTRLAGSQAVPDERFEITGELKLNGGGYPEGQINYTTKGVLERLAHFLPTVQLALLRGRPEEDGSFSNTLTITDGQVKLLAVPFAQLLPLF
ncbi:MAG: hypothetical protein JWQ89_1619 [Devosia sp.]|uniref:DUF2125 domain-containing protein n=1 Tax=Devosia sp. TaxID=1871048 RepID=UPI0026257F82|nr:DUF2125 domain-containing protein [Devosia sp.]MDB5539892.1 hypothetical protein [Devosia sp.]